MIIFYTGSVHVLCNPLLHNPKMIVRKNFENIVGEGENTVSVYARVDVYVKCLCWTSPCIVLLTLYFTVPSFGVIEKEGFENIQGKGENAVLYMCVVKCQMFILVQLCIVLLTLYHTIPSFGDMDKEYYWETEKCCVFVHVCE